MTSKSSERDGKKSGPAEERRRRERRERIFGEVLPESTKDDRDDESQEGGQDQDTWLRNQVPPHHG